MWISTVYGVFPPWSWPAPGHFLSCLESLGSGAALPKLVVCCVPWPRFSEHRAPLAAANLPVVAVSPMVLGWLQKLENEVVSRISHEPLSQKNTFLRVLVGTWALRGSGTNWLRLWPCDWEELNIRGPTCVLSMKSTQYLSVPFPTILSPCFWTHATLSLWRRHFVFG